MEVIGKLIEKRKFVNRGFLIGPYCPIYGHGAILITILLQKYIDDPIALFIMGVVVCSILEYLTSYFMEKIFHARWWDYSRYKFNINGRICLRTMIPFGLLGLFIMYVSNPFFFSIIEKIPGNILNIICIVLMLTFLVDNIISFKIISNVNITSKKTKDNTEEITGEIAEEITEKVKAILRPITWTITTLPYITLWGILVALAFTKYLSIALTVAFVALAIYILLLLIIGSKMQHEEYKENDKKEVDDLEQYVKNKDKE